MSSRLSPEERFISRHTKAYWIWVELCIGLLFVILALLNQIVLVRWANPHAQDNYATLQQAIETEVKGGEASRRIADELFTRYKLYSEQRREYREEYTISCCGFGAIFIALAFHHRTLRRVLLRFPGASLSTTSGTQASTAQ